MGNRSRKNNPRVEVKPGVTKDQHWNDRRDMSGADMPSATGNRWRGVKEPSEKHTRRTLHRSGKVGTRRGSLDRATVL